MTEFRVIWCKYPTNYNADKVLFVEAASKEDARAIAMNHVERRFAIPRNDFVVQSVTEVEPVPAGSVKER